MKTISMLKGISHKIKILTIGATRDARPKTKIKIGKTIIWAPIVSEKVPLIISGKDLTYFRSDFFPTKKSVFTDVLSKAFPSEHLSLFASLFSS
jgi:hypothetical protein